MAHLDFDVKNLPADLGASITMALVAVPDAIASAILAGVNPIYGFNALIVGTPIGSLFTSSQFMNLGSTAAMMLAVGGVMVAALDPGRNAGDVRALPALLAVLVPPDPWAVPFAIQF